MHIIYETFENFQFYQAINAQTEKLAMQESIYKMKLKKSANQNLHLMHQNSIVSMDESWVYKFTSKNKNSEAGEIQKIKKHVLV